MASIIYTAKLNNGSDLILPTTADTLVGLATIDTLTNKSLTAPKFADGGFIADGVGNELVKFTQTTSAINELTITNSATSNPVIISATGDDEDVSLQLVTKGSGSAVLTPTLKVTGATADGITLEPFMTAPGNTSELRFKELAGGGAQYVGFKAPDAITTNTIFTLPDADGSADQVLKTDGSGVLSFTTASGATTLTGLTDVKGHTATTFVNSLLLNTDGTAPFIDTFGTAEDNIGIGNNIFGILTTGEKNISLGNESLTTLNTGSDNVCVGYKSGKIPTITVVSGTVQSVASSTSLTITDPAGTQADDDYNGYNIHLTEGLITETQTITGYTNTGSVVTTSAFTNTFTTSATYIIELPESTTGFTTGSIAAAAITCVIDTGSNIDDAYIGYFIRITDGTNTESKKITDYVGSSKTVTTTAWANSYVASQPFIIIAPGINNGTKNTMIGNDTVVSTLDGTNQTCLGYGATATANNEITLGNSSVSTLRCADQSIAALSDQRDKTDIVDSSYGLDFVSTLRPVQFKWDRRQLYPGDDTSSHNGKTRVGFIAQELQSAMPDNQNDILDLVYDVNPERIEAKYGNLIPILTKAIQDLKAQNDSLSSRLSALETA